MADYSPLLTLPLVRASQASKEVTMNTATLMSEAMIQLVVENITTNAPPGSPAQGVRYIVGSAPTGLWSGKARQVAVYIGTAWVFFLPKEGYFAWDKATDKLMYYTGSAWAAYGAASSSASGLLILDYDQTTTEITVTDAQWDATTVFKCDLQYNDPSSSCLFTLGSQVGMKRIWIPAASSGTTLTISSNWGSLTLPTGAGRYDILIANDGTVANVST